MPGTQHPCRRHPAHHTPIERFNEPVIVEVTVCTQNRGFVLTHEGFHGLCHRVWRAADFWRVGRYVIMPDHIHLFCTPGRIPVPSLKQWVEYWKSRIATHSPGGPGSLSTPNLARQAGVSVEGNTQTADTEVGPPSLGMDQTTGAYLPEGFGSRAEVSPSDRKNGGPGSVPAASCVKLWQRDFWDTQMRSREHYEEELSYMRMNPVRKGLASMPEKWPHQGEVFSVGWM